MTDKTLKIIPGGGTPDQHADLMRKARSEMAKYADLAAIEAERKKILYDAYIAKGFTPEQALSLIK